SAPSRKSARDRRNAQRGRQVGAAYLHQQAAAAAVDVDLGELEDRALDEHRQGLARRERRGAADLVARVALRRLRRARLDALAARLARQVLGRDLAIAVHQDDERL